MVDRIFEELHILDRCCLALCSKILLKHAQANEHLEYLIDCPPTRAQIQTFFETQLGQGWVSSDLRYCSDCGRLVTTSAAYWRYTSERLTREKSGRISDIWRQRREDGWLRYWIERWCVSRIWPEDATASALKLEDETTLVCPRCAVVNPDCNAWRRRCTRSVKNSA